MKISIACLSPAGRLGVGLLLASLAFPVAAQERPVAFVNAVVHPVAGGGKDVPPIERGYVVVQGGKIKDVGAMPASFTPPAGATVIDCAGKTIIPGLVDTHNHIGGIGAADSSATIQPGVRVSDSVNPFDSGFRRAVSGGLTTLNIMPGSGHLLSGQTIYVKLRMKDGKPARTVEDLAVRALEDDTRGWKAGEIMGGIKMANGTNPMRDPPFAGTRGKAAAMVREQYIKAQEYREKWEQYDAKVAAAKDDEARAKVQRPAVDLNMEALGEVLKGKRIVHHHTHRADDIATVLRLARDFRYRVVLHHVSEAWKVAEEIKKAQDEGIVLGCSVILIDSPGGKLEAADLIMRTGAALQAAGAQFSYHTDDWITDVRLFLRMAALGVRNGVTEAMAIRSLTLSGAEQLDLQSRVGSLEPGKDADLVVLSGKPFSVYTKVEQTWVEGQKVFDRSIPEHRLYQTGGYGAGHDQQPYFCCYGQ